MYTGLHDELPKEFCKILGDEVMEIMKDKLYQRTGMNPDIRIVNGKLFPWMRVERYYMRTYDRLVESEGFIDHTTNIAFEEDPYLIIHEDKWKATDIETGLLIAKDKSFADLYDKVFDMADSINKRRKSNDYSIFKEQFELIKSGKLGRVVTLES